MCENHEHNHDLNSQPEHHHDLATISHGNREKKIFFTKDILSENNNVAHNVRQFFHNKKILCINIMSSPGSGKTSILEASMENLSQTQKVYVIEGDLKTDNDADRINKTGVEAIQINTGNGCHLEAEMIKDAVEYLNPDDNSIIIIENVGNLVCPSVFNLGEDLRIVVISTTEGEDKPLEYPVIFQNFELCIIHKIDLLAYLDIE